MDKLPTYHLGQPAVSRPKNHSKRFRGLLTAIVLAIGPLAYLGAVTFDLGGQPAVQVPVNAEQIKGRCHALNLTPGPPSNFLERTESDRFEAGAEPVLVKNATIWTGRADGLEVVKGDVFLANGLIKAVGDVDGNLVKKYKDVKVVDAKGAWVTPGIVDMHSHLGVDSAPELQGADDTNSFKGVVLPWLRSLDGLNTHDEAYRLSVSGGVTTSNVLPGSADAIGGQAFTIKLRPTKERSTSSLVLEPPFGMNGTEDYTSRPRWRQMKHACGENPKRVYDQTRMDTQWAFREAYNKARQIKEQQDSYCAKALAGEWKGLGSFPEDLQWEALVDVLRGKVKVHNHCYEAVDLDNMVRLTNEFKFKIAAFHHAHETYLVPDLLKKAYGGAPAIALFATNARYKREAYRGSEFAPRLLTDAGLKVGMKSDHPVLNSRYLLHEAQQAHYFGLASNLALASVISTPATILGYDHRIGFLKPGYDADLVIWDSHPLQIGATPKQVFIDGIPQLGNPFYSDKPDYFQHAPKVPNFDDEAKDAVKYEGLPPIEPRRSEKEVVIFTNVTSLHIRVGDHIKEVFDASRSGAKAYEPQSVVVKNGEIQCSSVEGSGCLASFSDFPSVQWVNLHGGSISPALVSYGSLLGIHEIDQESSTNDGRVIDLLTAENPAILGEGTLIHAVDGLEFATRDALLAYRDGATVGITAPESRGLISGLGVAFSTGAPHKLAKGAVLQDITAVHVSIHPSASSISTQIAVLRNLLYGHGEGETKRVFRSVVEGEVPLVIAVQNADIIASLIQLKGDVEKLGGKRVKFTFTGANEAHLLAKEIGEANIGVILTPARPYPGTWKARRILPGPPLSENNAAALLLAHNVTVALGVEEQWQSRNLRFDVGWTAIDAHGYISKNDAIALATINVEKLLGLSTPNTDLVAVEHASLYDFSGKVVGVISKREGGTSLVR
ncbi:composite domain of metallo-dependent hydrolase [Coprinellus micaceus]|uniref:Composite domain of metallo-dependent hydrolase n=1 Tax=Coprinellus micaceus TaxID=71717 RepID=A0A4Y7TWH7_COPMI|nr:composite domain of metallo-dependent hydrolase [Coprinellus micaceus]